MLRHAQTLQEAGQPTSAAVIINVSYAQ